VAVGIQSDTKDQCFFLFRSVRHQASLKPGFNLVKHQQLLCKKLFYHLKCC
jgi:hypothetical protein